MKQQNIRYSVMVNMIRTVTLTILSFISFPFACRALGDAGMGTYTWANTFVYYFLTLAKLGIPTFAIRECSKVRDDPAALNKKVQEFFIIQAVLTILSFGLMVAIVFSFGGELFSNRELIFLLSTNFLVGALSFEWVFIALEKHFFTAFRSIFALLVSAVMILLFIRLPENGDAGFSHQIYLYAFFTCLVTYITVFINLVCLRKHVSLKKVGPYHFKAYLKPLMVIFAISFLLTLYNQSDSFLLGLIDPSKVEVGSYSVGIKAIEIVITIITSLSAVFIPRATQYYKMENKVFFSNLAKYSMNICFFIAMPALVTLTTLSGNVTSLISGANGYEHASSSLVILASVILTFSIGDMIYHSILLPMGKEKHYLWTMGIGVVLNISLSLILGLTLKDNPAAGVAIATASVDFVILVVLISMTRKYSLPAIINGNNLKITIAALLVLGMTLLLKQVLPLEGFVLLIVIILIDALLYLGALLVMQEKLVSSFLKPKTTIDQKEP